MVSTQSTNLPHISGYSITEKLYTGSRTAVYRAQPENQQHQVVIKVLQHEYPSFSELVQFRNQYTIAKNLDIPGIVRPLSLEPWRNSFALVMEDSGSISLKEYSQDKYLDWLEVLTIALQLTEILHHLANNRVVHKDIKPANILIHPNTGTVELIDFSISSLLPKEIQELKNPNVLEGTLAYLAPEQTGRMNRGIDYRTDFYNLGVTLYELLTGELPFECEDALELVHCHIAKQPIPPHQLNQNIPETVSKIILKLMAKNAEDRYQSALGIKHDLEACIHQGKETGTVAHFELAQRDVSDRFLIPEKLYGREAEVTQLLAAFERIAKGNTELILVVGFSGIGKTAVVNEVHKPIVRQKGYFIKGKFDQFNRNIPFLALVQSLRDLMGQLLSESDLQLQQWKSNIFDAIGDQGQVIIEVIPELEKIIGKQPTVAELSGSAAQNRFNLLFSKFIQVFTTKEHPLVIFLDDLQWADSASLNLMKLLMSEANQGYLLLIGAYRDNEVFPAHPLMLTLDEIAKSEGKINTITLSPLPEENINDLVSDTLSCNSQVAQPLTELVYQKTKGNPFFTTQFFLGLYGEGLINFNFKLGHWQCDISQVRQRALTDDVVKFMAGLLQKLPTQTQNTLKLAACIGNQFDLGTLAIVCEQSKEDTANSLWRALQEGLILPQSEAYKFFQGGEKDEQRAEGITVGYRFLHDRVQQAAYSLIADDLKNKTHYQIGKLLYKSIPKARLEDEIFLIVVHLNQGLELLGDRYEKKELAQLNLTAGKKAIQATAYAAAFEYLSVGLELLPKNCWTEDYKLALSLHEELALANYLNGNLSQTQSCIKTVLEQAQTTLDKAKVCEISILSLLSQHKLQEAVREGLDILEMFGIQFPQNPADELQPAFEAMKANLAAANLYVENLLELPKNQDPVTLAVARIMNRLYPAFFSTNINLFTLALFRVVDSALRHGNDPFIPFAYGCLGFIIQINFNNRQLGFQFGQLAIDLLNKLDAKEIKGRTIQVFYGHVKAWQSHLNETIAPLLEGYQSALEAGDLEYAGYDITMYCYHSYFAGVELSTLEATMKSCYTTTKETLNNTRALHWQAMFYESVLNLRGKTVNSSPLQGTVGNEEEAISIFRQQSDYILLNNIYLNKMILSYLFEDYAAAVEWAKLAEENIHGIVAMCTFPVFYWYDSLIKIAYLHKVEGDEYVTLWEKIASNQEKFPQWMDDAPMNYTHKFNLVEAEKHRVLGQKLEAMELYDKAIAGAKENQYIQEEALSNELAAKFYLNWGKEKIAAGYMQEAYYCYARWGAKAKTQDLEKRYPNLLQPIQPQPQIELTAQNNSNYLSKKTITSTTNAVGQFDLAALMKASRTLSQEIDSDRAINNLMQVILENAGADTVALMLFNDERLTLEAQIINGKIQPKESIFVKETDKLPQQIINTVKHTQIALISDDARHETRYQRDSYIQKYQPRSLLCLPLQDRGKFIGILYLENNQSKGAFTSDRVEVLSLLCAQAAITLENARLYQQAQQALKLERELHEMQQTQLQLIQSEKMFSLGQLVGGVAHEINNPVTFIHSNLHHANNYMAEVLELLSLYQNHYPQPHQDIQMAIEDMDLEFVQADFENLLKSMENGSDRIKNIVTSLRTFSRLDESEFKQVDLHEGIESTLAILQNRLQKQEQRPEIKVVKDYGNLPLVECYAGQLNQVFLNIFNNAIDALEACEHQDYLTIGICTEIDDQKVNIAISDNGVGMNETTKKRLFDPFFTTKAVGKGTGLGLAIAHQIITESHGGSLEVESLLGKGTCFCIQLPIFLLSHIN